MDIYSNGHDLIADFTSSLYGRLKFQYSEIDHLLFLEAIKDLAFSEEFHIQLVKTQAFSGFADKSCVADYFDCVERRMRVNDLWIEMLQYTFEMDDTLVDVLERFVEKVGTYQEFSDSMSRNDYCDRAEKLHFSLYNFIDDLMYCIERDFDTTEHVVWMFAMVNLSILKSSLFSMKHDRCWQDGGSVFNGTITREDLQQYVSDAQIWEAGAAFSRKATKLTACAGLKEWIQEHSYDEDDLTL